MPVAGLLSDQPLDVVVAQSRACNEAASSLGWSGATPFLTLAFLALSVIPSLKLTDRGLVDVDRFELVPLERRRGLRTTTGPEGPAVASRAEKARYLRFFCFAIAPASRSPVMNMWL